MSNIEGLSLLFLLSHRHLRWYSTVIGLFVTSIPIYIIFSAEPILPETYWVMAVLMFFGIAMLGASKFIKQHDHLLIFNFVWLAVFPSFFWLIETLGCYLSFFSKTWCN